MSIRRALVIGIHPYKSPFFGNIPGAANDANAISTTLDSDRFLFRVVAHIGECSGRRLRRLREEFVRESSDADVVLFLSLIHISEPTRPY